MNKVEKNSYFIISFIIIVIGFSGLSTPFLTILFSYLALNLLSKLSNKKWLTIIVFTMIVLGILYGFGHFAKHALKILPGIISSAIPVVLEFTKKYELDFILPFDDANSFRSAMIDFVSGELGLFANYAKVATKEFVLLIIGLVIAASFFAKKDLDLDKNKHPIKNNLYSALCEALIKRFQTFYHCFGNVMGAQFIISSINTFSTFLFVFIVGLPHAMVITVITFLCGMLPIVGNLISNSIIFLIAGTVSLNMAIGALVYLIVIHKLEYFLNSKIIGERIRNPMWLTLIGLVVGEKLIGIPGMILAPVILNYFKVETAKIENK